MTSPLFTPCTLGSLELANRIVLAPMCQYAATNGCAGDWHLMHLGQFAVSGLGLMITEMTNVQPNGRITPHCMGLYDDATESAYKRVIDYCRSVSETPIAVQLAHAGRKASSATPWQGRHQLGESEGGWQTVGPSAIAHKDDIQPPEMLSTGQVHQLVEDFKSSAERAGRVGFDAIELHAAHGYLLHQFLSPVANRREDEYGGSAENRRRLLLEVFTQVRSVWKKPLGVRLSAIDWLEGGITLDDTTQTVLELEKLGCDWVDISSGGISNDEVIKTGPGYQVPFAERMKTECKTPVMAVGMITGARQAEQIISSGQADLVALARGLLFNPRWAWHAALELGAEVKYPDRYARCAPDNLNAF